MLSLVLLLFAQFTVPMHTGVLASVPSGCGTLPVTDSFTGSGALSSCWTQSTVSGDVPLVRSSGVVIPNTASSQGQATFTGVVFSTTVQYAQAKLVWAAGNYSGVCINMTVAGTGACYLPNLTAVAGFTAGSYTGNIIAGCAALPSGDVVKLSVTGGTGTVTDVTTSTVLCSAALAGYSGNPGILVDHRNNSTDSITNFEAD